MNKPKIFFQSSLPRAGSTLFQNLLGQNHKFHVTPTSGLGELIEHNLFKFSTTTTFKNQTNQEELEDSFINFCRKGIYGFYENITNKPFILEKSSRWLANIKLLKQIDPSFKVICLVRDLRGIICSLEKKSRSKLDNGFIDWKSENYYVDLDINSRLEKYTSLPPFKLGISLLENVITTNNNLNNILFIRYEDLCSYPEIELKKIYNFLELPFFNHDFMNIKQITTENDSYLKWVDHKIKPSLEQPLNDWENILGPEICNQIYDNYRGYYEFFNYKR